MRINTSPRRPFLLAGVFAVGLFCTGPVFSQVNGCTDPSASNYNAAATVNDGSCTYPTTNYTPPIKVNPLNSVLVETSGLQMAGGFLWTFNDGAGLPAIYRIDTTSSAILQTVTIGGATNGDWEDIAFDGTYFYIGDFGNNHTGGRTDLKIYKVPFSAIPTDYTANPDVTVADAQVEIIHFTYSDQPQPAVASGSNNTRFDCEAMIVDGGNIHLFSKNWVDVNTTHYVINGTAAGTYVATPVETLATNFLVTAADKLPGSNVIVLLGYVASGFGNHFMEFLYDYSGGNFFNGNKRKINLPDASIMGQAEGIAFRNGRYGYISNEYVSGSVGGINYTTTQKLRYFNTDNFLPASVLPLALKSFSVKRGNGRNELSWNFASPVKNLSVQYSADRANFSGIASFDIGSKGNYSHQPTTRSSYYRLAWKTEGGKTEYSETVNVTNSITGNLSGFVLRSNGDLLLTKTGDEPRPYSFRLVSAEGKVVAERPRQVLAAGQNKITFPSFINRGATLILEVACDDERTSVWLKVH